MKRISSTILLYVSVVAIAILSFVSTALAAGAVAPDDGSILDLARPVIEAIKSGQWALGGSLAVILLVAAARRYLPDSWGGRFVRGDVGGVLSTFVISFASSLAVALAPTGAAVGAAMLLAAAKFALGAIGGYVAIHKLASALVATAWWAAKAPTWLKSAVGVLLALIGSSAVAKAEKAGQAAVDANPPGGAGGAAGEPASI